MSAKTIILEEFKKRSAWLVGLLSGCRGRPCKSFGAVFLTPNPIHRPLRPSHPSPLAFRRSINFSPFFNAIWPFYPLHALMFMPLAPPWRLGFPRHSLRRITPAGLTLAIGLEGVQYLLTYRAWNENDAIGDGAGDFGNSSPAGTTRNSVGIHPRPAGQTALKGADVPFPLAAPWPKTCEGLPAMRFANGCFQKEAGRA